MDIKKNGEPFHDKEDEWEAYKRGAAFGQKPPNQLSSLYDKIQPEARSVSILPIDYRTDTKSLQKMANKTYSAFRYNGVTYISDKLK